MTNEDAIKYLKQLYPYGGHCWLDKQRTEAIGMAIEALKEEPTIVTVGEPKEAEGALKELLDNIDEKELTKVREEMMQEEPSIPEIVDEHSWEMFGEEPVSEDLEEAIDAYLATYFGSEKEKQEWPFLKKMAIHFAEWQKQKDSIPISEELEEACEKFRWNIEESCYQNDNGTYTYSSDNIEEAFKAGAKWQQEKEYTCYEEAFEDGAKWKKKQMIKDAISAKVTEIYYPTDSCLEIEATLPESRFKDGDKVLIIKKD